MVLIEKVINSGVEYDYIHFFQGADIPLNYFKENSGTEFVSIEFERKRMAERKAQYIHLFCHNRFFRKISL